MKYSFILIMVLSISSASAQNDSTFIERHVYLRNLVNSDPVMAFNEGRSETRKKNKDSRGLGHLITGNVYWLIGNLPEALSNYYEALGIFEETGNKYGLITTYNDISLIFMDEENYESSLENLWKAKNLNKQYQNDWLNTVIYSNLGEAYLLQGKPDSAEFYTRTSVDYALVVRDSSLYPFILKNLGIINQKLGNNDLAKKRFFQAVEVAEKTGDKSHEIETLGELGNYYLLNERYDSSRIFLYEARARAKKLDSEKELFIAFENLRDYYKQLGQYDSAYHYGEQAIKLSEIIKGGENIRLISHYENLEELRQEELRIAEEEEKEAEKHFMQYMALAVAIILLIGLTFVLAKTSVKPGYIEVWLVVMLLIIFEYITLIVHSVAGDLTHHSPILMLLILVSIASILGPLHHKTNKHAKRIFIEKKVKRTAE